MIANVISIVMGYFVRIAFTAAFSKSYLGINGLFTEIIGILSLSELGVETSITYALYKPIEEKDEEKQKQIMLFYRNIYRIIAVVVACIGLILMFFLPYIIKDYQEIENVRLIFFLYIFNSVSSYFLIYKKTLIDANQKAYITTIFRAASFILQDVLQIILLKIHPDFILYLLIGIAVTLGKNIAISKTAEKMYPFLKKPVEKPLPVQDRKDIWKNVRAMMMNKVGTILISNTDNILLSMFSGIQIVGIYSNYNLIISAVKEVLARLFEGISASVGSFAVANTKNEVEKIYSISFFIAIWTHTVACICLYIALKPFVYLSFGTSYTLSDPLILLLVLLLFISGIRKPSQIFHDSLGLFWHDRYKAPLEAVLNIVFSVIFAKMYGTIGVFLGTLASAVTSGMWIEPHVIYKYGFDMKIRNYLKIFIPEVLAAFLIFGITVYPLMMIHIDSLLLQIVVRLPLAFILSNILIVLLFRKKPEFQSALSLLKTFLTKRRSRES